MGSGPLPYKPGAELLARVAGEVLKRGLPKGTFLSLNFPAQQIKGVRVVPHSLRAGLNRYERRENPELMPQVQQLRSFAQERQVIVVCLSQINRSYDPAHHTCPGIEDVRLPNPLDLSLFDRMCFLHQGKMQIITTATTGVITML